MSALTFAALRRLSHEEFRSGERIAHDMGMSRAALWNALNCVDELGVRVFKVHGRGYRLAEPLNWLAREEVLALLGTHAKGYTLEIVDRIASTNTTLFERASAGAPSGTCLVAELQTQGRGRRGREWISPLGGGLAFSLLWRFSQGAALLSTLSLAVGVAVVRAVRELGIPEVMLKWPNDIVHRFHKLGGILIELQGDLLGPSAAVIGIGLNVRLSEQARAQIAQPVTDLWTLRGDAMDRNQLLATCLRHLGQLLRRFETEGFRELQDEWRRYHAYHDRPVRLQLPNRASEEGRVAGIAEDGSLLLETARGEQRFTVGEISLRGRA
jgi:BirA family transcriptional regulator, biotin operon repressor / biotin---[acetyl-CoA-carboxylase] ligase